MTGAEGGAHGRLYAAGGYLLWATGVTTLSRVVWARHGRFALLLHGTSARRLKTVGVHDQPHLTATDLGSMLEWLRPRFAFLSPDEYLRGDKAGVLLTFDDGFANNYRDALPVLRSFRCPGLFFVTTQHVIDPRDWLWFVREQATQVWGGLEAVPDEMARDWYDGLNVDELRECAADPLVTIGSHTLTHPILPECDDGRLERELRESRSYLEQVIGRPVEYFAYPRGDYDQRVATTTERAGYKAAFTIDPLAGGHRDSLFELPRVGIYEVGDRYLSLKLSGLHRRPSPVVRAG